MGAWSADSKTHVASMSEKDFFGSEKSLTIAAATDVKIEFTGTEGESNVLKASTPLLAGEIIDASVFNIAAFKSFIAQEIEDAKAQGVLFSLHLKATMMKVSDPLIFGAAVSVFYKDVYEKYADLFAELGISTSNGLGDVYAKIKGHEKQAEVEAVVT